MNMVRYGGGSRARAREGFCVQQDESAWYSLEYGATSARMASLLMSG